MGQNTSCGFSHTHLLSIPNVGDFRLGFDDYEIQRASGEGSLKVLSNRVLSTLEPGYWTFEVTLFMVPAATYRALIDQAYRSLNNFLATGRGDITVNFSGMSNKCYILKVPPKKSFFDYDGLEYLEEVQMTLVNPSNTLF